MCRQPEVRVIVRCNPDLQRQAQAILRLLGYGAPNLETPQPQDGHPGATTATGTSGRHIRSEHLECTTPATPRT